MNEFAGWTTNVRDQYKHLSTQEIKSTLAESALPAAILMINLSGDFNIGTVIRSANAFNLTEVFYFGKKKFDRRGAVGCHNYTDVTYLSSMEEVVSLKDKYEFVAMETSSNAIPMYKHVWKPNSLIIMGCEAHGLSEDVLSICDHILEIPMRGSVRSFNVGSCASMAMYDYVSKVS